MKTQVIVHYVSVTLNQKEDSNLLKTRKNVAFR